MISEGESPFPPEASAGRSAESNCVASMRGGEQLEADLQSQTLVNTIRPAEATSLLETGVMEGLEMEVERDEGTPQGVSPLLANIYLNSLDHLLKEKGYEMVRYADDMVVLTRDAETARQALELIAEWMREAGLRLHPQKTRVVSLTEAGSHFDFLGCRFWKSKSGRLKRFVRPKSRQKLKARIKPMTKRTNGQSMSAIIQKLNPILRGWYGYYKQADSSEMKGIDGWVRGRLRSILRKRGKRSGGAPGTDHQRWPNR